MAGLELGPASAPLRAIFSHANGFNARTYLSILAPVATQSRILALDLRGHGATTLPTLTEGRTSWADIAADLLAVMELVDARDVILSGHSMGATTSLLAAAQAPARVRALVLFEPVILPRGVSEIPPEAPLPLGALRRKAVFPHRAAALAAYRGRGPFAAWTEAMLGDYVRAGFRDRPDGQVELACAPAWEYSNYRCHGHDGRAALKDFPGIVRILKAEHESTCSLTDAEVQSLGRGRIRMETAPATTHFLPMERPELVAGALRAAGV